MELKEEKQPSSKSVPEPAHKRVMYKTNYTKLNKTKLRERGIGVLSVGKVIAKMATNPNYILGYPFGVFLRMGKDRNSGKIQNWIRYQKTTSRQIL